MGARRVASSMMLPMALLLLGTACSHRSPTEAGILDLDRYGNF